MANVIPSFFTILILIQTVPCFSASAWHQASSKNYRGVPGYGVATPDDYVLDRNGLNITSRINGELIDGLKVKWLGTAGFEISDNETTILVDPFVTRPSRTGLSFARLRPDQEAIEKIVLNPISNTKLDAILVTHDHHDHVMDVPYILSKFPRLEDRPIVVGSPNVEGLIQGHKLREPELHDLTEANWDKLENLERHNAHMKEVFNEGQFGRDSVSDSVIRTIQFPESASRFPPAESTGEVVGQFGNFKVTAFLTDHPAYKYVPFQIKGTIKDPLLPMRASGYVTYRNSNISYLITYRNSVKLFFQDSFDHDVNESIYDDIGPVDIIFQGIAARGDQVKFKYVLEKLKPRFFIPTHFENFFRTFRKTDRLYPKIWVGPRDYSGYEPFLNEFKMVKPESTELGLMKLFYYYSLKNL